MNSKLYYEFSKELNEAEKELKVAKEKWKLCQTDDTCTALKIAECKFKQWQKAMNLLYIRCGNE